MRIDFYLLETPDQESYWLTACRLLEKAYQKNHRIFVYCDKQEEAEHLDELLWTFKPESFIPHHLQNEGLVPPPPIQIGIQEPKGFNDILLNLSQIVPDFSSRFNRIIQIVRGDEQAKVISREHFRTYRQYGLQPQTHVITPN